MFSPEKFVNEKVNELQAEIRGKAIIACSGGVDSTVAAVIVSRAISENQAMLDCPLGKTTNATISGPTAEPTFPPTWNSDWASPYWPPEAMRASRDDSG